MSVKAMQWATRISTGRASYKAVLCALAWHHNGETNRCDPSVSGISEYTELDRKTVLAALAWLADQGLIAAQKCNGARTKYTLLIGKTSAENGTGLKTDTSTRNGTGTKNGTGTTFGQNQYQKRYPKGKKGNTYSPLPPKNESPQQTELVASPQRFSAITMPLPPTVNPTAWETWCRYRSAKRKPVSEIAARRLINEFSKFDHEAQMRVTEHSIQQDYQGWFPPKGGRHDGKNTERGHGAAGDTRRLSGVERTRQRREELRELERQRAARAGG